MTLSFSLNHSKMVPQYCTTLGLFTWSLLSFFQPDYRPLRLDLTITVTPSLVLLVPSSLVCYRHLVPLSSSTPVSVTSYRLPVVFTSDTKPHFQTRVSGGTSSWNSTKILFLQQSPGPLIRPEEHSRSVCLLRVSIDE